MGSSVTRLPEWLILGAPKAGTTTLADWLREHPGAFVSHEKEIGFFEARYDRGVDWYASHFAEARPDQRVGEATPAYLYFDRALDRIAELLPDVRLAVVLREPAARAWSHVWYFRSIAVELRDPVGVIESELEDPTTPIEGLGFGYLHMSRYVDRLQAVVERFGREPLLVLLTDDLRADPDRAYGRLCSHLGLEEVPAPDRRANVGGAPRSLTLQRWIVKIGSRLPSTPLKRRAVIGLMRANRRAGYPDMPPDLEQRVRAELAGDNDRLADWLGRELPPTWSSARR